jgi:hypothetical protein
VLRIGAQEGDPGRRVSAGDVEHRLGRVSGDHVVAQTDEVRGPVPGAAAELEEVTPTPSSSSSTAARSTASMRAPRAVA